MEALASDGMILVRTETTGRLCVWLDLDVRCVGAHFGYASADIYLPEATMTAARNQPAFYRELVAALGTCTRLQWTRIVFS